MVLAAHLALRISPLALVVQASEVAHLMAWYDAPYKKGTAVGPATLPRVLRPPTPSEVMHGYDVLANKRATCRAGRWGEWAPDQWDDNYWKVFALGKGTGNVEDSGIRGIERQEGLDQNGVFDDVLYQRMRRIRVPDGPHKGEPIYDGVCVQLLNLALKEYGPGSNERRIREAMTDFFLRAEANEEVWHYTQRRPYTGLGVEPEKTHENDCSSYAILGYYWARKVTGLRVPDPSGYGYGGYGNTWDDLDGHPRVTSGNYFVGDLAHYDGHVTICRKSGDATSSVWSSFGSEFGPDGLNLYYRGDFIKVVRPPLL